MPVPPCVSLVPPVLLCNRNASGICVVDGNTLCGVGVLRSAFPLVNWTRRLDACECGVPCRCVRIFSRDVVATHHSGCDAEMSSLRIWDLAQSTGVRNGVLITRAHSYVGLWCVVLVCQRRQLLFCGLRLAEWPVSRSESLRGFWRLRFLSHASHSKFFPVAL